MSPISATLSRLALLFLLGSVGHAAHSEGRKEGNKTLPSSAALPAPLRYHVKEPEWVPDFSTRRKAAKIDVSQIAFLALTGNAISGKPDRSRILVDDPQIIRALMRGLRQAVSWKNEEFSIGAFGGVEHANLFVYENGRNYKPLEADALPGDEIRTVLSPTGAGETAGSVSTPAYFPFEPSFPRFAYGMDFNDALLKLADWHTARVRTQVSAVVGKVMGYRFAGGYGIEEYDNAYLIRDPRKITQFVSALRQIDRRALVCYDNGEAIPTVFSHPVTQLLLEDGRTINIHLILAPEAKDNPDWLRTLYSLLDKVGHLERDFPP